MMPEVGAVVAVGNMRKVQWAEWCSGIMMDGLCPWDDYTMSVGRLHDGWALSVGIGLYHTICRSQSLPDARRGGVRGAVGPRPGHMVRGAGLRLRGCEM
jgi:hypothetical protein